MYFGTLYIHWQTSIRLSLSDFPIHPRPLKVMEIFPWLVLIWKFLCYKTSFAYTVVRTMHNAWTIYELNKQIMQHYAELNFTHIHTHTHTNTHTHVHIYTSQKTLTIKKEGKIRLEFIRKTIIQKQVQEFLRCYIKRWVLGIAMGDWEK